jgi:hypothetical protein
MLDGVTFRIESVTAGGERLTQLLLTTWGYVFYGRYVNSAPKTPDIL